jgi:HEAT repeat protein
MSELAHVHKHLKTLKAADENARREAARALKQIEAEAWKSASADQISSVVEMVRHHLQGNGTTKSPPVFRQDLVVILGNIGPRASSAIPQLTALLEDGVFHGLREAAVTALGKIGTSAKPAVDKLLTVLESDHRATLAPRVAFSLGAIGYADKKVRSALVNLWLVPTQCQNTRVQAGIALCKLKLDAPGLIPTLAATLVSSPNAGMRKTAAEALSWRGKTEIDVVPALTAALYDADEEVCKVAEIGLNRMKLTTERAIQLSSKQLKDSVHAETALRRSGAPAVPALISALSAPEAVAREKAAKALGAIGEPAAAAAPALNKALADKTSEVRLAAAKALWNVAKQADPVVKVLAGLLEVKWPNGPEASEARRRFLQTVIEALARIGPPAKAAVPALLKKAKDANRLIRESAVRTLRDIDPAVAAPVAVAR